MLARLGTPELQGQLPTAIARAYLRAIASDHCRLRLQEDQVRARVGEVGQSTEMQGGESCSEQFNAANIE